MITVNMSSDIYSEQEISARVGLEPTFVLRKGISARKNRPPALSNLWEVKMFSQEDLAATQNHIDEKLKSIIALVVKMRSFSAEPISVVVQCDEFYGQVHKLL